MTPVSNKQKRDIERPHIRIGILGCSDIARRRFLPALRKARNARLSMIAGRDPEKAKRICSPIECEITDYDALLDSNKVDLVYISLPNHLHEAWTLRALEQGKHVICEKPLGLSSTAVARMTARAEQKGLLLYENIVYLHHPVHHAVRQMVAAGTIGRISELRACFGFLLKDTDGFRTRSDQGGGAFFDQARYPLSAALFFLSGRADRFQGRAVFRNGLNVAMTASALTDRNERFSFSIGFEQSYECWYELVGEKGTLRVDRAYTTPADMAPVVQVSTDSGKTFVNVAAADHFTLMIERVCEAILQKKGYHDRYNDARRLALLAEKAFAGCVPVHLGMKE